MVSSGSTRVDVAIQSFKKPESLIFTLLTLHSHCADLIDTVYIRDDSGQSNALAFCKDQNLLSKLSPWKVRFSATVRPTRWSRQLITRKTLIWRSNKSLSWKLKIAAKSLFGLRNSFFRHENDIRYQWAINETDKQHLLIIHDDVMFKGNIVDRYLDRFSTDPQLAVIGQLGQCWRCGNNSFCDPSSIMHGFRPPGWPLTPGPKSQDRFPRTYFRDCRINEWCCMIDIPLARVLSNDGIYFGNYEDRGDVGAYWLSEIISRGFNFRDDFSADDRESFYRHGWQGHTGHSVWADQGVGISKYNATQIVDLLKNDFNYSFREDLAGT